MPLLLVISGPPGVGKSTVADAVAVLRPATRLSIEDAEEAMRACGIPDARTGVAAYEVVRAGAEQNLALGQDVVVDAVNDSAPARETWERAARATGADLVVAVLALDDRATHRARLEGRRRPFERIEEPTWAAVEALMARTESWGPEVLRLDAELPAEVLARSVLAQVPLRGASNTPG